MFDAAEDGQLSEGSQGQDPIGEYFCVFLEGVNFASLPVPHLVHLSVCSLP